jgi:hypothetical protein
MKTLIALMILLTAIAVVGQPSESKVGRCDVLLKIEQIQMSNDIQITVADHYATSRGMSNVVCKLSHVDGTNIHERASIPLTSTGGVFVAIYRVQEVTHGGIVKVTYKTDWIPHHIETWTRMYYH